MRAYTCIKRNDRTEQLFPPLPIHPFTYLPIQPFRPPTHPPSSVVHPSVHTRTTDEAVVCACSCEMTNLCELTVCAFKINVHRPSKGTRFFSLMCPLMWSCKPPIFPNAWFMPFRLFLSTTISEFSNKKIKLCYQFHIKYFLVKNAWSCR